MLSTHISLLQQLREGQFDAWREMDHVYRPLIANWMRQYSFPTEDIEDITQEVMTCVVKQITDFDHNGQTGAFRNWLRTTTVNLARNHLRKKNVVATGSTSVKEMLDQLEDPASGIARRFDHEHDRLVVQRLLQLASGQFQPQSLIIFRMHVLGGASAKETAAEVGVSEASVHAAKSRVLRWLRQQASDWIGEILLD